MPHEQLESALCTLPLPGGPRAVADAPSPLAAPSPLTAPDANASHDHARRARHQRFVRRVYRLRTIGLGLGAVAVGSVLALHREPTWLWMLLALNGLAWPHAAALIALQSDDPRRAELRNLTIDSAAGGAWLAVMQFNVVAGALLVTMLTMDKMSVGGAAFAARTSIALLASCALVSAALGFPFDPSSPTSVILACIPFVVVYPMAVANMMYALGKRVTQQNRRLEELGRTDGLTGLANRGEARDVAARELARHSRTGRPATLMIADIDRFKAINDRYGHPRGDDVLRRVAETLDQCCRGADTPARYGGDEFLLVLPDTTLHGADELARRIRKTLDAARFERAPELCCTISIGAAEARADTADVDEWINEADTALYRAKFAGRDRFETALPSR